MICEILTPQQAMAQQQNTVAAIGNLDGVHLGHQALVAEAKTLADRQGLPLVVVSFEPHPKRYFDPDSLPSRLSPAAHKAELVAGLGVSALINVPFTRDTATMEAENFVSDLLVEQVGLRALVAGPDFRFGKQRKGDLDMANRLGLPAYSIEWQQMDDEIISSSRIRRALRQGDVTKAAELLGRRYEVRGTVERGDQLGRTIGFPTANLETSSYCLPMDGIYAALSDLGDGVGPRPTALYVGKRPSVDGVMPRFEAHLLDFEDDIYGRELKVSLVSLVRGDLALDGLDALKAQIERDCAACRAVLMAS